MNEAAAVITALGSSFTAVAAGFAALQVRVAKKELVLLEQQARTAFEDDLSREYRTIVADLPAEAFYEDVELPLGPEMRKALYRYFDLSNEQLFLASSERINGKTEKQWRDGIKGNITRLPTFKAAWAEIAARVPQDFFEDLRRLVPPGPARD